MINQPVDIEADSFIFRHEGDRQKGAGDGGLPDYRICGDIAQRDQLLAIAG